MNPKRHTISLDVGLKNIFDVFWVVFAVYIEKIYQFGSGE